MGVIMLRTAVPPLCHGAAQGLLPATVPLCIDMSPLSTRRIVGLYIYYTHLPIIPFPSAPYIHSHLPLIPFSSTHYINNEHMSRADAIGRFWPHIG